MENPISPLDIDLVRYNIALQSSLPDLLNLCSTDVKFALVCQDDYFWRLKYEQDYPGQSLYPGETGRSSYMIRHRLRPFGYYPDDEDKLLYITYDQEDDYYEIALAEPGIFVNQDTVVDPEYVFMAWQRDNITHGKLYGVPVLDIIMNSNDPIKFASELLVLFGLNRLNITFSESIDLLFLIMGSGEGWRYFFDEDRAGEKEGEEGGGEEDEDRGRGEEEDEDRGGRGDELQPEGLTNLERVSLLSSLNNQQLRDFLGNNYRGFPDYPSLLSSAITDFELSNISSFVDAIPTIRPDNFDLDRYNYIRSFEMNKIIRLYRCYTDKYVMGEYPPYLFVSCMTQPDDVNFERRFLAMTPDNYITTLNVAGIRTGDQPTYDQGLMRMSVIYSPGWILYYEKELMLRQLGIPISIVDILDNMFDVNGESIDWNPENQDVILRVILNYLTGNQ